MSPAVTCHGRYDSLRSFPSTRLIELNSSGELNSVFWSKFQKQPVCAAHNRERRFFLIGETILEVEVPGMKEVPSINIE